MSTSGRKQPFRDHLALISDYRHVVSHIRIPYAGYNL